MMARSLQDQFIDDDEEETCPLCVEELDLTDKGFRPCPCGYQVCQFCYHNVKTNMNGLCPACRRPYSEKDISYNPPTEEEKAAHKIRQATKQKKSQAALQKEKQRAEADHLSRKHLAGLRVVQKNLVYVTGLEPTSHEEQLLQTLRGDQYFGQYGKIVKIVVSKARDRIHPDSVGVYVTYESKEDAESCIKAVNGTKNGDRTLRAQFGTTKYCSAYLRGEQCQNRQCMFLHEPGEANESYSRADLSSLNAGSSQRDEGGRQPPPQSQQPVAASQPMMRQGSDQPPNSPAPDRPALPSTASWASKPPQYARSDSRPPSTSVEQGVRAGTPASSQPEQPQQATSQVTSAEPTSQPAPRQTRIRQPKAISPLLQMLKNFSVDDFKFVFNVSSLPSADVEIIKNYPPLFDENGGAKRRIRRQREEEQRRMEQEAQQFQQPPAVEQEENPEMSGSLQLGGEPEDRQSLSQASAIRPPGQEGGLDPRFQFGGVSSPAGISERGLTPQQHQQLLLQTMKSPNEQAAFLNQQASLQQSANPPGHQRNTSRFSFANDTASASASVKPVANQKLMNQQSSMMPQQGGFGGQTNQHFFTSNVQGPPPGLKTTGTPPVSGGMTFGQGHGFATGGLAFGAQAANRNNAQEEMMRNLLRGRDAGSIGGGSAMDMKRELHQHFSSPPNHYTSAAGLSGYPAAVTQAPAAYVAQQPQHPNYAAVFPDGEKQQRGKKKGKKHSRQHGANAGSSSASSGLMDMPGDAAAAHMMQNRFQASAPAGLAGSAGTHGGGGGMYGPSNLMHGGGGGVYGGRCFYYYQHFFQCPTTRAAYRDVPERRDYDGASFDLASLPPSRQASIHPLDDDVGSRRSTPPVPPGFEALANESRRSTPSIPPGFSKPTALPPHLEDDTGSRPTSRPSSRASLRRQVSNQVIPALPLRPGTPGRVGTPGKQAAEGKDGKQSKDELKAESTIKDLKNESAFPETPTKASKSKAKHPDAPLGAEKTLAPIGEKSAVSSVEKATPAASEEQTAAATEKKDAPTDKKASEDTPPVTPAKTVPAPKSKKDVVTAPESNKVEKQPQASQSSAAQTAGLNQTGEASTTKAGPNEAGVKKDEKEKRKHPGKLDITAAVDKRDEANAAAASKIASAETGTPGKAPQRSTSQAPKPAESPSVASPSVREKAPRTLRVVQTPKGETPPATSSPAPTLPNIAANKQPSRQPSVASFNVPGTPSSEQVSMSDNISITSASQSRPTSPPPPGAGKVGTAPVRAKTKNQMKKERQERAKQLEEEKSKQEQAEKPIPEEPVQEAIVSRKKKTKKEKEPTPKAAKAAPTATNDSTPAGSRPTSPGQKAAVEDTSKSQPSKPATPPQAPPQSSATSPREPSPPPTPTLTAAQIMQELKTQGPEIQKCIESLFRTPNSAHFKPGQNILPKDLQNSAAWKSDFKLNLTKDEVDALLRGTMSAVHYGGEGGRMWDRGMVTGSGAHLRALTEELETRFMDLERALRDMPDELRFHPSKPQNETPFPSIDLEALRRQFENAGGRGVSVMEQMVQDGSTMKKGAFLVDEASKYINEFVMPPVTPPPSASGGNGGNARVAQAGVAAAAGGTQGVENVAAAQHASPEITERQLHEAKRVADEKENALKKVIKKNKRLLGLG
ncbi:hypothetical protein KC360_g1913 [Hortaea werneckii]|nr:hypothetical protein KC325_g2493 [Hortaea werneckii]KAI6997015.1 hypothetical protein KC359_g3143 [Hortaea werneckii]KAI7177934.1 hypothetical protein KC360_g1913 [Hortaea werneckii]